MTESDDRSTTDPTSGDRTVVEDRVHVQPVVVPANEDPKRGFSLGSFVAGFVAALVAAAIAAGVFLAVSDSDDDGEIEVDVPAVDVDVDG